MCRAILGFAVAVLGLLPQVCIAAIQIVPDTDLSVIRNDLFDYSQGTTVLSSSPALASSGGADARSVFGYRHLPFSQPENFYFSDAPRAVDFITFKTATKIDLYRFELTVQDDSIFSDTFNRGISSFKLFASADGTSYSLLSSSSVLPHYTDSYGWTQIVISDTVNANDVQYFRLEVTRRNGGPRIIELDGFAAPESVPEPATLTLWSLGALGCAVTAYRRRKPAA
jgi:hypothetical protein